MAAEERDLILRVGALFQRRRSRGTRSGPLLVAVRAWAATGRRVLPGDTDFRRGQAPGVFDRWFDEVAGGEVDLASFWARTMADLLSGAAAALNRLLTDYSALAQVKPAWSIT